MIADGNLTVNGNLTVSGFYPVKPYIGLRVVSGVVSANVGYVPTANITIAQASSNAYTVTFTPAHPTGVDFLFFAQPLTTSSSNTFFSCTTTQTNTVLTVWCRDLTNAIVSGNFYIYTVP